MNHIATHDTGILRINPGHAAGVAQVQRYLWTARHIGKGLAVVAPILGMLAGCLGLADHLTGGAHLQAAFSGLAARIDWTETSAMLLGLLLALSTGVPMGFYLMGLMGGYHDSPYGED